MKEIQKEKLQDVLLHCVDCDKDFVFTSGEQFYYGTKELAIPKRCAPCRKIRKDSIARDGWMYHE